MTVELAEAEAMLKVCEWRRGMLLREMNELTPSPDTCFGCSFERVGQRALLLGGWSDAGAINTTKYVVMFDAEVEHEKRRRLNDEFHAKLERERYVYRILWLLLLIMLRVTQYGEQNQIIPGTNPVEL